MEIEALLPADGSELRLEQIQAARRWGCRHPALKRRAARSRGGLPKILARDLDGRLKLLNPCERPQTDFVREITTTKRAVG
jgi:hypothetical protein